MNEKVKEKFLSSIIMRTRLYIIAILSIVTMVANAQTYGKTYTPAQRSHEAILQQQAIQSQQIMQNGNAYKGTVFEPFGTAVPSDQSEVSTSSGPTKHLRRGYDANGNWIPDGDDFGGGAETGNSTQFPIGDALLPMMIFATLFAGVFYLRRKKTEKTL